MCLNILVDEGDRSHICGKQAPFSFFVIMLKARFCRASGYVITKTPRVLSRFRNSSTLLSLLKMSVTFASDCSGLQVFSWRSEVTEPQTEGREI